VGDFSLTWLSGTFPNTDPSGSIKEGKCLGNGAIMMLLLLLLEDPANDFGIGGTCI
jgi:hypothetical protein